MNKVNLLENVIGKSVEEWTVEDLQNAEGDFSDIYTDETVDDIIRRSSNDVKEIFMCVKVSKNYKESCDKLNNILETHNNDTTPDNIIKETNTLIESENIWDRLVSYWAASDPLSTCGLTLEPENVKNDIQQILLILNVLAPEYGFAILTDCVDAISTIQQFIYEHSGLDILVDSGDILDEILEKLNLVTYQFYDSLKDDNDE